MTEAEQAEAWRLQQAAVLVERVRRIDMLREAFTAEDEGGDL
jgi:hypothetical protein